ncbi:MAG: pseudouridine synthase [Cytophagales bacterium]|nr:pseudouridine synthase [Cytophagales bacterium]
MFGRQKIVVAIHSYYIIYKPYGMLSQFSIESDAPTLAQLHDFPKDVYPVGRLDADTEGLLILTNDTKLNYRLLSPTYAHKRTYYVQTEGVFSTEAIQNLQKGTTISVKGKVHHTQPCHISIIAAEPALPPRNPPIRYRANIPTTWVQIILTEGKNHQVRKMTASQGFPTLRLVRVAIENVLLNTMQPGDVRQIAKDELYNKLNIK